ncbi:glycosyltransferase [Vibrio fluvialis]|nr:glycosyltransferase [Vibrio fluvialis]
MKILHLVHSFDTGGVEKWLSDLNEVQSNNELYFLKQREKEGFFEDKIKNDGGKISSISFDNKFIAFFKLIFFLKKEKFDVVHSHLHFSSGWLMLAAFISGVNIRVTHSHTDDRLNHRGLYSLYTKVMRCFINAFSNKWIACSRDAAECLFGCVKRSLICPCGVKLESPGLYELKPDNVLKLCHVGRFNKPKNHAFLIRLIIELEDRDIDYKLELVGVGPELSKFKNIVKQAGLSHKVDFLGSRDDIAAIMKNNDIFLFPSLNEGLGLALIEAQLYGLFSICSEDVPDEAIYGNCRKLDIHAENSVNLWADLIEELMVDNSVVQIEDVSKKVLSSNVNIYNNLSVIEDFYTHDLSRC